MDNDGIRAYLLFIKDMLTRSVARAELQETEEGPVLLCAVNSPFDAKEKLGYRFSLTPVEDGLLAAEVILFVVNDAAREAFFGLNRIINRLNPYISLGSFRLFEPSGSVLFTQGMLFAESLDVSAITETIGISVGIMEQTVLNAGAYFFRFLNGESPETLLAEIDGEG